MSTEHTRHESAARYAAHLRERIETQGILQELAGYPNFVVWRYREVDGQRKKPPFDPTTHTPASPTDSTTWGTLERALQAVTTGTYQGIGFMLSHSPFSGVDLDYCIAARTIQPWAQEIIETLDYLYCFLPITVQEAGQRRRRNYTRFIQRMQARSYSAS